jgi:hypothetical protein
MTTRRCRHAALLDPVNHLVLAQAPFAAANLGAEAQASRNPLKGLEKLSHRQPGATNHAVCAGWARGKQGENARGVQVARATDLRSAAQHAGAATFIVLGDDLRWRRPGEPPVCRSSFSPASVRRH